MTVRSVNPRPVFSPEKLFEIAYPSKQGAEAWSQGCMKGDYFFVSEQVGLDQNGWLIASSVKDEIAQAYHNAEAVIEGLGATWDDVIYDCYVPSAWDDSLLRARQTCHSSAFKKEMPASTGYQSTKLPWIGQHFGSEFIGVQGRGGREVVKETMVVTDNFGQEHQVTLTQACRKKDLLYISVQHPVDEHGRLVDEGSYGQAEQVCRNIERVLKKAGGTWDDIIYEGFFLTGGWWEEQAVRAFGEVSYRYFRDEFPAMSGYGVKRLHYPGEKIAVEAVAVIGKGSRRGINPRSVWTINDFQGEMYGPKGTTVVPISQACTKGKLVYVAGQLGVDVKGHMATSIPLQVKQLYKNIDELLKDAGASWEDVAYECMFTKNVDTTTIGAWRETQSQYVKKNFPAMTIFGTNALAWGEPQQLEIEAIAVLD